MVLKLLTINQMIKFIMALSKINILNGGTNFDVIDLPKVVIPQVAAGTTALVQPVISGSLKEVIVDQQNFDIEKVLSITISGGGGSGASLRPVVTKELEKYLLMVDNQLLVVELILIQML